MLADRGDHGGALRHRAAATVPPDAALAVELEGLAERLARHPASRAEAADVALLAARFTPTPSEQTRLRLLAAHHAGASKALAIVSELEGQDLDPDDRVRCLLIRIEHDDASTGQGIFRRSTPTSTTYLSALEDLEDADLSTPVAHQVENWRAWLAMETLHRPALERAVALLERRRAEPDDWEWSLTSGPGADLPRRARSRRAPPARRGRAQRRNRPCRAASGPADQLGGRARLAAGGRRRSRRAVPPYGPDPSGPPANPRTSSRLPSSAPNEPAEKAGGTTPTRCCAKPSTCRACWGRRT